jgi:hypothetical protein
MDQSYTTATGISVLVAFPGTGSPSSFVQSGNYLALGMFAQGQTSGNPTSTEDYGYFAMVYLTNSGQPMIIGEVWKFSDIAPSSSFPIFLFGESWTCDCFTTSTFANLAKLTMSWGSGQLNWLANVGGVDYSLFSYTPESAEEQYFHIGTIIDNCSFTCTAHKLAWFQFGVMTQQTPQSSWAGYIGLPEYYQSKWIQVVTTTWLGGLPWTNTAPILVDHIYSVGTNQGNNEGYSCRYGGSFPGFSSSLVYGELMISPLGTHSSDHAIWDVYCQHDLYPPSATFSSSTPAAGSWQNGRFTAAFSDSETGAVKSGLALCFWSVDSLNSAGTWVSTLSTRVRGCNSTQTVTVGSAGYCQNQGANTCRVNVWAEDYVGNGGGNTVMIPSNGDAYTEGTSSSWQMTAESAPVSVADDTGTVIVGGKSVKGTWSAPGTDITQMIYPRAGGLGIDVTTLGNNALLRVFIKSDQTTSNLNWVALYTDASDGFSSPTFQIGGTNWNYVEWTIGANGQFTKFGNGDWTKINSITVHFDYAPGFPSSGNVWVDGLGLIGALHGGTIAGVFFPDYASPQTTRSFSIDTVPPSSPVLIAPPNSATLSTTTPTFSWTASAATSGIASYTLLIDTSSSFNSPNLQRFTGITGTSYSLASPLSPGVWYWEVQSSSNAGNTAFSSVWQFTIPPPDFSITASPVGITAQAGAIASSTINIASMNGFTGTVNLSTSVSTSGLTCTLSPSTIVGSGSSSLSCTGSAGVYTVTVTGTSGSLSHPATVTFTILDLMLSASPSSVPADFTTTSTIVAQLSNSAQGVSISFSTNFGYFPSTQGSTATCTTGSTGSCTVTIKSAVTGVATITAAASGYPTHQVSVTFFDFSATVSPTTINTLVGTTTTATVSLTSLNGFAGTVSLATNVLQNPAGMGCSVSPNSVILGSSATATVTCTPTQPGSYTVVVLASSGTLTHGPTIAYTVSTLAPTIDGTATAGCGHTTNQCQTTFSTSHTNDIVIVYTFEGLDLQTHCTFGVSDTAGLSWTLRASVAGRNDGTTGSPRDQIAEFWARSASVLSSDVITETISGCASTQYGGEYNGLIVFGVSGANFNSPFDPNTSLPGSANNYSNTPSVTISTSTSNDLIIAAGQQTSYGALTPGTGFTGIYSNAEYQSAYSPLTNFAVTFGDSATWYWEQIADAIRPAPPALDGSAQAGCSHSTNSCSLTFSTTHAFDIIVVYTFEQLDLKASCTFSVQDTAGLTWNYRGGVSGRNDGTTGYPRDQIGEFWARSPNVLTSDVITESISGCASTQYGGEYNGLQVFGVTGANYNTPFDPNVSVPGTANNYSNTPSVNVSTTLSNDMIISAGQQSSYGTLTPGSGFTGITSNTEYQIASTSVTNFSVTWGDSATWYWEMMADAIQ